MAFDPKRHTIRVQGGREYLPVSARLVWFRNDHPDWGIVTQPVEINLEKQYAIFQCSIFNEDGKLMATATKMENVKGFGDYLEKAETGAVGRALAYCGYGTQFAPELEEGGRFSDAPLAPTGAYGPAGNRFARQAAPFGGGNGNGGNGGGNYRPNNNGGGGSAGNGGVPSNDGNGNGGNGGYNGSPRPLSPRPLASRPESVEDESPFDEEMPRRAPASNGQDAPRAEASRPFPPRENINPTPAAPRPSARPERSPEPEPEEEAPAQAAPTSPAPAARAAAPGGGIQRVREPEPEVDNYDPGGSDDDDEDPFGEDDDLPMPAPVAKAAPKPAAPAAPKPASDGESASAKTAPRTGIRPLGEEDDGADAPPPPLVANRCSVEGCMNTLTAGQLTMSMNKFGRPICLLHQKDATPVGAAASGARRNAKPAGDTLL